jgi:hypothetical protein
MANDELDAPTAELGNDLSRALIAELLDTGHISD